MNLNTNPLGLNYKLRQYWDPSAPSFQFYGNNNFNLWIDNLNDPTPGYISLYQFSVNSPLVELGINSLTYFKISKRDINGLDQSSTLEGLTRITLISPSLYIFGDQGNFGFDVKILNESQNYYTYYAEDSSDGYMPFALSSSIASTLDYGFSSSLSLNYPINITNQNTIPRHMIL